MSTFKVRPAAATDAKALSELAERTFRDTFAQQNSAEDMAAHSAHSYSQELQLAQILSPDVHTLLIEKDGALAGFAQLRFGFPPNCVTLVHAIELWRFYIDRPWLGQGLAQQLMEAVRAEARSLHASAIWLGVWEHNKRAQAFYAKYDFHQVGSHVFMLGSDKQTDLILVCDNIA